MGWSLHFTIIGPVEPSSARSQQVAENDCACSWTTNRFLWSTPTFSSSNAFRTCAKGDWSATRSGRHPPESRSRSCRSGYHHRALPHGAHPVMAACHFPCRRAGDPLSVCAAQDRREDVHTPDGTDHNHTPVPDRSHGLCPPARAPCDTHFLLRVGGSQGPYRDRRRVPTGFRIPGSSSTACLGVGCTPNSPMHHGPLTLHRQGGTRRARPQRRG